MGSGSSSVMAIDGDRSKQDRRSPQELAKAILDHEFSPQSLHGFAMSFREQLWKDYLNLEVEEQPVLGVLGRQLLLVLKELEAGMAVEAGDKKKLRGAVQVIDAYKKEAATFRDESAMESREEHRRHGESLGREAAEWLETHMVEISNLKSIDKLLRCLASRVGVPLSEPGHGR